MASILSLPPEILAICFAPLDQQSLRFLALTSSAFVYNAQARLWETIVCSTDQDVLRVAQSGACGRYWTRALVLGFSAGDMPITGSAVRLLLELVKGIQTLFIGTKIALEPRDLSFPSLIGLERIQLFHTRDHIPRPVASIPPQTVPSPTSAKSLWIAVWKTSAPPF